MNGPVSLVGRGLALYARGPGFELQIFCKFFRLWHLAPNAGPWQCCLVSITTWDFQFIGVYVTVMSWRMCRAARLAQLVEHSPCKRGLPGSSPRLAAHFFTCDTDITNKFSDYCLKIHSSGKHAYTTNTPLKWNLQNKNFNKPKKKI